jgi:hypothetical protein
MSKIETLIKIIIPENDDMTAREMKYLRSSRTDVFELMYCCYKLGYAKGKQSKERK